jgi:MoxR-like ATPase
MNPVGEPSRFRGAAKYVLDDELAKIVNVSIALEMPLLLKGEPGTGRTMLAHAIAESLEMPLIVLNVKSSMKLLSIDVHDINQLPSLEVMMGELEKLKK